jgi:hypothetical protein
MISKISNRFLRECGGAVKIIASIENSVVINKILAYLERICRAWSKHSGNRGSFLWLHFIRRQGIGRPAGRNQYQKNAKR